MLKNKNLFILLIFVFLTSCTHSLHQYHVGEVEFVPKKYKKIQVDSKSEQRVILGFVTQTDYVNDAFKKLQNKCASGMVTGINTRYSTSHGFFSWTNTVKMTGTCVR